MRQLHTWTSILVIVLASSTGDVLLSHAMKQVGDVGELRRRTSILTVAIQVFRIPYFWLGVLAMTAAFYSLLFALSWAEVSIVGPAAAALTFIANAVAAKIFLQEKVDHRRWIAALLVAGGVVLLAL
ncbi:MAG: hypothetical protein JOY93_05600 [Acidobacteriales bacterium]|nr:hypothetical protein [Terriglobales bacterium]